MRAQVVLLLMLCCTTVHAQATVTAVDGAEPSTSTASAAPAEPSLEELARRLDAAHAEADGAAPLSSSSPAVHVTPREKELLQPGGITRTQLVVRQGLPGLATAGVFTLLVWTAPPVTLALIPVIPLATAGMVQAIGDKSGGQARYGRTLLGAAGGMGVGLVVGIFAGLSILSEGASDYEDEAFSNAGAAIAVFTACTATGTAAGSVLAYNLADRANRQRKVPALRVSASATPLDHGALASLSGRF